ncbi:MAG: PAS domain S-box protein [Ramlibacter sp.]|nr:PAS domain S-box protein [Ramlibacter sp.]
MQDSYELPVSPWPFLPEGRQVAALIANFDWGQTTLGDLKHWPQRVRHATSIMLRSEVPMVMLWGECGVMVYNDAYAEFAGARHPQLLGSRVREGWPEAADFNDNVMREGLAGRTLQYRDLELTLYRSGRGEQVCMNLDYSPLVDESGHPVGVMAIVIETSDKVRAERALRTSEAQFRMFAQAVPNQVWSGTPDGMLDWFNQQVYDYSGHQAPALDGQGWAVMVHPQDLPEAAARWGQALAQGVGYETEFRLRRHDGAYRWHLARAMPVRNDDGAVVRWIGSNTDIEDQKAISKSLADLNQNLEQQVAMRTAERNRIWRLSADLMLVADFEARIISLNPAWGTALGWQDQELVGRSFLEFVHPEDLPATLAETARLAQGATTFSFENRYRHSDGSYRDVSWTAVPDEGMLHAVGRDVTADRESARALRRTEAALQQAQKMESVGQLTGGVAHDFNNLLQVIAGNLQLLARDVAGHEKAQTRVTNALAAVHRGSRLASQLLAFARRQPLEPRVVSIGRFITGMEDMLRRSLGESIEIEIVVSGGLWRSFVDPAQVENAVLNLAINARDAMNGVGKLTIEAGNAHLDDNYVRQNTDVVAGQYVVLAVTDTGSGMPPDVAARAFEPFFSTKPEGKGTGLGLSMVYGFVRQSGGHVKIYSEQGHGTTVKLYLPRTTRELDAVEPAESRIYDGGDETILVAEDDDQVRQTVVELLTELGYRVLTARDAAGALAVIESGAPIDLLFTDVVMPGSMRSPELARLAKARLPGLAVLFTSGYTENAIVHGGRLDAGVDLLGKPYTQEALARKVRQVLAKQRTPTGEFHAGGVDSSAPRQEPAGGAVVVLLVDDEPDVRSSTAELVRSLGYEVLEAGTAAQAMKHIEATRIDILVTDIGLPDMTGDRLAVHARERLPQLGLVFASGASKDNLPEGARLLVKPFDFEAIASALQQVSSG